MGAHMRRRPKPVLSKLRQRLCIRLEGLNITCLAVSQLGLFNQES